MGGRNSLARLKKSQGCGGGDTNKKYLQKGTNSALRPGYTVRASIRAGLVSYCSAATRTV